MQLLFFAAIFARFSRPSPAALKLGLFLTAVRVCVGPLAAFGQATRNGYRAEKMGAAIALKRRRTEGRWKRVWMNSGRVARD
ncbi:hypothetical protein [Pantoea ananatis]|uniref:hypothetical protein n=1 Tax=Pantoea ananas TaxID=553 RepID=UPI00030AF0EB|nr:hypothetical protein [Pantoea ananatis]PKC39739.1 hypothetical protein V462_05050 [Pantoea ananatis 15320]